MNSLVYNEDVKKYDFSSIYPWHPFTGKRFDVFIEAFKKYGFDKYLKVERPEPASEEDLLLVHTPEYIERAKEGVKRDIETPLDKKLYTPARLIVGTSKLAGELVWSGKYEKAIGIGGGLHHAKPSREEGFCIFNDVAICAKNLLNKGAKKVLILDTDAHAGNGTSEIFYENDNVLFIDLHQDPRTIYPGTGYVREIGSGKGEGYTVNVPLPPGASDDSYKYILDEIFDPLARQFKPDVIIRNGGSDPHFSDALTDLGLTLEGFKIIGEKVREVSSDVCNGRVADLITSGYNLKVLPYAWLSLIGGLIGVDVDFKETREMNKASKLEDVKEIVREIKNKLSPYWSF